ncbi:hypothetical protein TanjilG_14816 [Lupinus angustifolius]|uniref:Uncharacterized protein n=1 Tax=Lupinus angustifolius TaxID=3871 RepID=A0A1J7GJL8_LUPAN|nr:hypothetical protein TanjilG_14816 [Lupinus angustifolius]
MLGLDLDLLCGLCGLALMHGFSGLMCGRALFSLVLMPMLMHLMLMHSLVLMQAISLSQEQGLAAVGLHIIFEVGHIIIGPD